MLPELHVSSDRNAPRISMLGTNRPDFASNKSLNVRKSFRCGVSITIYHPHAPSAALRRKNNTASSHIRVDQAKDGKWRVWKSDESECHFGSWHISRPALFLRMREEAVVEFLGARASSEDWSYDRTVFS